jgi:hypothetical protein
MTLVKFYAGTMKISGHIAQEIVFQFADARAGTFNSVAGRFDSSSRLYF